MFVRWNFTVWGATQNSFAISSFESPRASAPRMVSSRSVRPMAFALARSACSAPTAVWMFPSSAWRSVAGRSSGFTVLMTYAAAPRPGLGRLRVRRRREHHHLHVGVTRLDLVEAREPVHVRHADVEEDEVG